MQAGRLPLVVALLIALVTGIVPLRECHPTDGCVGGVVAVGSHGHDDAGDCHHDGDGHDGHDGHQDCGESKNSGCIESPLTVGVPRPDGVVVPPPGVEGLLVAAIATAPLFDSAITDDSLGGRTDTGTSRAIRSVVLLR